MRLDAPCQLMVDWTQGQVAFELFEGLFDLGELEVKFPQLGGIGFGQVAAQKVAAFASPGSTQGGTVELPTQGGVLGFACAVQLHLTWTKRASRPASFLAAPRAWCRERVRPDVCGL